MAAASPCTRFLAARIPHDAGPTGAAWRFSAVHRVLKAVQRGRRSLTAALCQPTHTRRNSMTASDFNTWATRAFLTFLIGAASPLVSSAAWSQASNYPSRPITVIVPFAAGGPADIYARVVSKGLQESL